MKKLFAVLILLFFTGMAFSQKPAYVIYDAKGKKANFKKMAKTLAKKDVVLFGELHNNAIAHWLQYELTEEFFKTRKLILGAEMFEADNQKPLTDYVQKRIDAKKFAASARLWKNYKTDYAPLVDFAKDKNLHFVATNIPRRYANLVYKNGFGALNDLSPEEKSWIAPLPMPFDSELKTYKNFLVSLGDHGSPELVMAQATKDATMAHFILKNYKPKHLFLHFNGSGHSDQYEGIVWYLKRQRKDLRYGTISTINLENVNKLPKKYYNIADFIIVVDSNMTSTY